MYSTITAANVQVAPEADEGRLSFRRKLAVSLRWDRRERLRTATAVSPAGLFVETPEAIPFESLVQVLVALPGHGVVRSLMNVVRIVSPEEAAFCGGMPGLGLRFFLPDTRLEEQWTAFLRHLDEEGRARGGQAPRSERDISMLRLSRRREDRLPARFRVRLKDRAEMEEFYTSNVSRGGMFLATDRIVPIGTRLSLFVRHPVTGRDFALQAVVRWVNVEAPDGQCGVGVQIESRTGKDGEAFVAFMNRG